MARPESDDWEDAFTWADMMIARGYLPDQVARMKEKRDARLMQGIDDED